MEKSIHFLDKLLQNRIALHVLFWLFVLFLAPLVADRSIMEVWQSLVYRGVGLPTKMIATYFLAYYLIPRYFQKEKYFQFIIYFVISSFILCVIYRFNNVQIAERLAGEEGYKERLWEIVAYYDETILGYIGRVYSVTIPFIFIKMLRSRGAEKRKVARLEKEKIDAELNFLKAQIHPHFLFNTLNNLYALTLKKSDRAPDVVAKLSEILDYMLYQCKEDRVLVSKEITLLEHYLDLEKLRYGERLQLTFDHDLDDHTSQIAPLILISIVENAFKHGVSGAIQQPVVAISIKVKEGVSYIRVYNSKPATPQIDEMGYKKGIGETNVKRQLELIYPERYEWNYEESPTSYEVNLTIQL
ncbi:sensor histidine kinase [uncultured Dokdonia sp.]|uniref:sensor histidine kinase n=1 Tax=uncultured Dokdonia sp. TaxID=575653 RepID=UPI0026253955|nr:sensor histidine kinase [uncultured Dokdonia sp.]